MSYVERRRFLWILFFVALTLLAIAANATTLVRMRFEELAQQATAVARLRCLSTRSFWHNGEIWTDTQFEVVELAKGALPATVVVRTLGGTLGRLHSSVEESPVFHSGEEIYLFLWGSEDKPLHVLGWSQGTFRIAREISTNCEKRSKGNWRDDKENNQVFEKTGLRMGSFSSLWHFVRASVASLFPQHDRL